MDGNDVLFGGIAEAANAVDSMFQAHDLRQDMAQNASMMNDAIHLASDRQHSDMEMMRLKQSQGSGYYYGEAVLHPIVVAALMVVIAFFGGLMLAIMLD